MGPPSTYDEISESCVYVISGNSFLGNRMGRLDMEVLRE